MAEVGGDTGGGGGSAIGTGSVSSALWGPGWLPSLGLFLTGTIFPTSQDCRKDDREVTD